MKKETSEYLNYLSKGLLTQAGKPGRALEGVSLASWEAAIESCGLPHWEQMTLDAANEIREQLAVSREKELYAEWNHLVRSIKPLTERIVAIGLEAVRITPQEKSEIEPCLQWDLLSIGMHREFVSVCRIPFYAILERAYESGHFPCGWTGDTIDAGEIVIF
ncbi:MAG: hypothetical protein NXI24_06970 [bacterium]|nr:hypothetical protein [bacterium]